MVQPAGALDESAPRAIGVNNDDSASVARRQQRRNIKAFLGDLESETYGRVDCKRFPAIDSSFAFLAAGNLEFLTQSRRESQRRKEDNVS
jgi:hypothetical protein